MTHNTSNQTDNNPFYSIIGMLIGAILALAFAKTGNPGFIGVGAALGLLIGTALNRRFKENN